MTQRTDTRLYMAVLAAVTAMFAVMSAFTPLQIDDLMFVGNYLRHIPEGWSGGFSWGALAESVAEFRQYDNSRLSNILLPVFMMIKPLRVLFPLAVGASMAWSLAAALKLAGYGRGSGRAVAAVAVWGAMVLFLPWRNYLLVADYALNYPVAGAVTLLFIVAVLRSLDRPGWKLAAATLLLAVPAGAWHEGYSLTTLAGMGIVAICRGGRMPLRWWGAMTVYAAATVVFGISPGMLLRSGYEIGGTRPGGIVPVKLAADILISAVAVGAVIVMVLSPRLRPRLRRVLSEPAMQVMLTITVTGTVLSLVVSHTPRTAYWPDLAAIIVLARLCRPAVGRLWHKGAVLAAAATLAALLAVHGIHCIVWQKRFFDEDKLVMAKFRASPEASTVFHDVIMPEEVPVTTLYFPLRLAWTTPYQYTCLEVMLNRRNVSVVPLDLRRAGTDADIILPGDAMLRRTGSALWRPDDPTLDTQHIHLMDVTLADGTTRRLPVFLARFPLADGTPALYIKVLKHRASAVTAASRLSLTPR